jgi:hypothetical protein
LLRHELAATLMGRRGLLVDVRPWGTCRRLLG